MAAGACFCIGSGRPPQRPVGMDSAGNPMSNPKERLTLLKSIAIILMEKKSVIFCLVALCLGTGSIHSQTFEDDEVKSVEALKKHGFENLAACEDDTELVVTYENRIYRYEIRALHEVLDLIAGAVQSRKKLVLVPQSRGIPIVAVCVDMSAGSPGSEMEKGSDVRFSGMHAFFGVERYWEKLRNHPRIRSSKLKLDVFVHPELHALFGSYINPVKTQINAAPSASTLLRKGMSVSVQWVVPIQNELGNEGDQDRPGLLALNQTVRCPAGLFISGTAGYFSEHRYGADLEIRKYWNNGRWTAGAEIGRTGFAAYYDDIWYYSRMDRFTFWVDCGRRFESLNLTAGVTFGKFVYGDSGVRFDIARQFGEVRIGFFGLQTSGGKNGGLCFTVPIFPQKRLTPGRIRVSPAWDFPWSYRYRGLPQYGIQYATGSRIGDLLEHFNPDLIETQYAKGSGN
jgi:hypothetical protein